MWISHSDGSGFITRNMLLPINEALNIKGATSFQIRLPTVYEGNAS